jgi:hypothetical protein
VWWGVVSGKEVMMRRSMEVREEEETYEHSGDGALAVLDVDGAHGGGDGGGGRHGGVMVLLSLVQEWGRS